MLQESKIFVAGGTGMVGSAIIRNLRKSGFTNLVGSYHSPQSYSKIFATNGEVEALPDQMRSVKLDLTRQGEVESFFKAERPDYVFLAAAKVGGIKANSIYPAQFIHDNLTIQNNVIHAAYRYRVKRLLFLGSSCIYPKFSPQPMKEEHLLSGYLEPTNEPYAIAKIAGIKMCEAYNRQYGTQFMAVMPTNLYGTNDNFDLETSHVLPALIRKFHEGKISGNEEVSIWGSGKPRREFLHVDDMAEASVFVMNLTDDIASDYFFSYPKPCFVNVGSGTDCSIKELAETIKRIVGYRGKISFDRSMPDGTLQKLLDVTRLAKLGWKPKIDLAKGIQATYTWYVRQLSS